MSIRTASVALGATFSPTGGTATSLVLLSSSNTETKTFLATTGVTPLTRTEVTFSAKLPKVSPTAPGGFTQGRAKAVISTPKVLANLKRTLNTGTIEIAMDPESTVSDLAALKSNIINILNDVDFDQLWLNQSVD